MSSIESLKILKQQFMLASTDEKRIEFARKYVFSKTINTTNNSNNIPSENLTLKSNQQNYMKKGTVISMHVYLIELSNHTRRVCVQHLSIC
jgi:CRISPR/Cas system-associated endonuclease Cas1